jgi:hypothetical protein
MTGLGEQEMNQHVAYKAGNLKKIAERLLASQEGTVFHSFFLFIIL